MGSSRAVGAGPLPAPSAPLQRPPHLLSEQPTSPVLEKQRCPWMWDKRSCPPTEHRPGLREAEPRAAASSSRTFPLCQGGGTDSGSPIPSHAFCEVGGTQISPCLGPLDPSSPWAGVSSQRKGPARLSL